MLQAQDEVVTEVVIEVVIEVVSAVGVVVDEVGDAVVAEGEDVDRAPRAKNGFPLPSWDVS